MINILIIVSNSIFICKSVNWHSIIRSVSFLALCSDVQCNKANVEMHLCKLQFFVLL